MVRSIESKDVSIISGLFEPDFVLKGCKGVYDKTKIIALLEKLPTGTKFSFTLKSSQDTGSSIKYTVSITGFDKNEVIAEFILNKKDQQLESGSVPACQPKSLRGFFQNRPVIPVNRFFAEDTPVIRIESSRSFFDIQNRPIVQKFLDKIERAFTSKDSSVISDLFFPSFTFLSCGNHVFNRTETVHSLMSSDWHGVVTDAKDLESIVNLKISFNGLSKKQFVGEFLLDKAREQLAIGAGYNCDKGIKSRGFIAQDNAQATVEKFLVRMVNAVGSGEKSLVSGLFGEKFSFKGCKGTYTRDQAVAMLMFIPKGTNFGYKITSVEDLGSTIKCTTVATGLASSEVEFDFVLNKNDDKLESAEMPNCGSRRLSTYAENADDVINRFLGQLKETIASRDSTSIGKLFDDNFLFKGCKGTYTKS
uniref:FACT complex subunit SSRP1 n=1 Tax=Caenorhabditis tropicalis TaxID=1561998 RepID=A0A1I7UE90_9PELO